jgi:hypothetical protein
MLLPLDGPSIQGSISVTTASVQEIKVGLNPLEERKVISIQPKDGRVYVYFGNGVTVPSAATVAADGFIVFNNALQSYEASSAQRVYIRAVAGTVNVAIVERA